MRIVGIIPSRYGASRFPGKPLADINGKPMVVRVVESALAAEVLDQVVVATDDERILQAVTDAGYSAVMTRGDHPSGTDRCLEAALQLKQAPDCIVNIQGDEPFVPTSSVQALVSMLRDGAELATLCTPLKRSDIGNPNRVKVVRSKAGNALYFSRASIPFDRDGSTPENCALHVGLYGYALPALKRITAYPVGELESTEGLEQLRWLENDEAIRIAQVQEHSLSVDTPEDLQRLIQGE